VPGRSDVQNI